MENTWLIKIYTYPPLLHAAPLPPSLSHTHDTWFILSTYFPSSCYVISTQTRMSTLREFLQNYFKIRGYNALMKCRMKVWYISTLVRVRVHVHVHVHEHVHVCVCMCVFMYEGLCVNRVCCSVLQCAVFCCSMLQCVALQHDTRTVNPGVNPCLLLFIKSKTLSTCVCAYLWCVS